MKKILGIVMDPTENTYIDNAVIGDEDVCYSINTGEGKGGTSVIVTNSTIMGWHSYGDAIDSVRFTNCTFVQGTYYTNVFGRLVKPYVNAVFENCDFGDIFLTVFSVCFCGKMSENIRFAAKKVCFC